MRQSKGFPRFFNWGHIKLSGYRNPTAYSVSKTTSFGILACPQYYTPPWEKRYHKNQRIGTRQRGKDKTQVFDLAYDIGLKKDVVFNMITRSKKIWDSDMAAVTPFHENLTREALRI